LFCILENRAYGEGLHINGGLRFGVFSAIFSSIFSGYASSLGCSVSIRAPMRQQLFRVLVNTILRTECKCIGCTAKDMDSMVERSAEEDEDELENNYPVHMVGFISEIDRTIFTYINFFNLCTV